MTNIMDGKPKVSVIIPIFKVENYIERCVRSLFEQTLSEIEYIFVNDCTPDKSMEVLQRVIRDYPWKEKYINIINHPKNQGLASARNSGLKIASGDFFIFCDSDDWVEKEMYEQMYTYAKIKGLDVIGCDFWEEHKRQKKWVKQPVYSNPKEAVKHLLLGDLHGGVWAKMIRKSFFDDAGITFPDGINMWEDLLVSLKIYTKACNVGFLSKPFYHYVQYNENSIISTYNNSRLEDSMKVGFMMESFLKENGIYDDYRDEFLYRMSRATNVFVFRREYRDFNRWRQLWPEAHEPNLRYPIPWNQRKIFDLILSGHERLALILVELKQILMYFLPSSRL